MIQALAALVLLLGNALGNASASGSWQPSPDMPVPVTDHRATLLADGRVLITGGYSSIDGWPVPVAQIYDPRTQSWMRAADMHVARSADTATLLADGKVLVIGGLGIELRALSSAEVYDPANNTWTLTPPLPASRFSHSASLLPDGRVLVVAGIVKGRISRTTLLYNPRTDRWKSGPPTRFLHSGQMSVTLKNHDVLIAGAYGGGPERFDPALWRWSVAGATPRRRLPIMELLRAGDVLLASGESTNDRDFRPAVLFEPRRNRWIPAGTLRTPRNAAVGALLTDGRVLLASGEQPTVHILRSVELYNPSTRRWTSGPPMSTRRGGATATALADGTVLVCGGAGFDGVLVSCEVYHP